MRFRFSLRTLFIAATIVAIACYWLALPTIQAQRFVQAVASKGYERADLCFRDPDDRFLQEIHEKNWRFAARTELEPWSFKQFFQGQRLVKVTVAHSGPCSLRMFDATVVATRSGLMSPQIVAGSVGSSFDVPLIPRAPTS